MHLSIRWRLALWYVLALAFVLMGFSALVYGLLSNALQRRIDHVLLRESEEAEEHAGSNLMDWIRETYEHEKVACVIYDGAGNAFLKTPTLSPASVNATSILTVGSNQVGEITIP